MPSKPLTLRALATQAGVSVATMSLALRNSNEISTATRTRLQKLATEQGYRPNPHVAKLMTHLRIQSQRVRPANICTLLQSRAHATFSSYSERLSLSMCARAEALGYAHNYVYLDEHRGSDQLQRMLTNQGVEGLVIFPIRNPSDLDLALDWNAFSTVAATSSVVSPSFHRIIPNHFDNMLLACRSLTEMGFHRIGLAMTRNWDKRVNYRWTGAYTWHAQFCSTDPVAPLIVDDLNPDLTPDVLTRWIVRERPDAVILQTMDWTIVQSALGPLRLSMRPAIVTMNWPDPGADCGIDQCVERIGTVTIEQLAAMINRGETGVAEKFNSTLIDGVWNPGKLSAQRRAHSAP